MRPSLMPATVNDLLHDAKALPEDSRIDLAERILESLDYSDEVKNSHLSIIEKRAEEVRSGKVKLIPAEQVFREADALLKKRQ
jgi:putative addiction module component (TIGR02574 family)